MYSLRDQQNTSSCTVAAGCKAWHERGICGTVFEYVQCAAVTAVIEVALHFCLQMCHSWRMPPAAAFVAATNAACCEVHMWSRRMAQRGNTAALTWQLYAELFVLARAPSDS
jgi:hypothetical protein